jgi:hypothetical protein
MTMANTHLIVRASVADPAQRAALDHGTRPEVMQRLVADFDKAWPTVKRSREIMTLAQEAGG